ncbi:MAG TPA: choice-of-anchor R domain-containing protein [Burkholderiales bacterium]|nr:choice-of-anchor R domain-containing protein [Burkholderiales bacterium]
MNLRGRSWIVLAGSGVLLGCSSITITKPLDQSTNVAMPQDILVTENGNVTFGDVYLDSFNMSRINGTHWQYVPQATLFYVPPGKHTLLVQATDSKLNTSISQSSTFTVSSCRLCYSCPAPETVHPIQGQCCDGGACDASIFGNFGPPFFQQQKCQQALFPGSGTFFSDLDCIGTQTQFIQGTASGSPQMAAVSFSPTQTGKLAQIQAPVGWTSGTNGIQVWITNDAAGKPGTVFEAITINSLRNQPTPTTVVAPAHIFSATHPSLTSGTKYWLVIGPAAPDTVVQWNLSLDDVSIPAATTLLLNTTNSNVAGPWAPKSNLQELRPAFEIDIRP